MDHMVLDHKSRAKSPKSNSFLHFFSFLSSARFSSPYLGGGCNFVYWNGKQTCDSMVYRYHPFAIFSYKVEYIVPKRKKGRDKIEESKEEKVRMVRRECMATCIRSKIKKKKNKRTKQKQKQKQKQNKKENKKKKNLFKTLFMCILLFDAGNGG